MIRQFKIRGLTTGVTLDLNDFNKFLLTNPSGLGIALTNEYIRILNKRINVSREKDYKPITATIEVSGETRSDWEWNYAELRDFIVSNIKDGFALYYLATTKNKSTGEKMTERHIICDVKLLSKTEKTTYGILVPVEFEIRSNWLEDRQVSVEVDTDDERGLGFYKEEVFIDESNTESEIYYNYGFLFNENEYNYKFTRGVFGEAELINDGDNETPLLITITSPCTNPLIRIFDANNIAIRVCKINVTVGEGEKLVINSDAENLDAYIITALNEKYSCVDRIDLSFDGFIQLPVGEYSLRITDDLDNNINGYINFSLQYLGG